MTNGHHASRIAQRALMPTMGCRRERARAVTAVFGSLDVGAALGLVICGPLIRVAGWPAVFYLFAGLGAVWCVAWPLVQPEREGSAVAEHPRATASGSSIDEAGSSCPWLQYFVSCVQSA